MDAAASIIAFAQVAKAVTQCIIATRELWKQIKDLPEEIRAVAAELQIWAPLFADLESQLNDHDIPSSFWDDKTARAGLEFATSARSNFESFVNDLSNYVNSKKGIKRKMAAAKICLRREAWERFEKKLSRSLTLLQHSIQFYQLALTRYSPHVIARRVTNDLTKEIHGMLTPKAQAPDASKEAPLTQGPSKEYGAVVRSRKPLPARAGYLPSYMGRFKMVSAKDTGAWQACIELPSWLSKSVFELTSCPRLSGWSWSYRVYNVVPRHSEIIIRVQEGDLRGILELASAGKASLFDKDEKGNSLLYYATQWNQYDICRMLIHNGLGDLLDDQVGDLKQSPLSVLTYERGDWRTPNTDLAQITELYQSVLEANGSVSVERLFDFIQDWAISDDFVVAFQEKFMPKWYHTSSLHDRLEAFRLGSFHLTSSGAIRKLITRDREILALDVRLATQEKLSLLHSVGIALGIRYADEMLPYKRGQFQWRVYTEDWGILVSQVAAVAQTRDLHAIETITPWDVYQVPIWTATPLISVLGGALCYISPETTLFHWDRVLQGTLQQWLKCLQFAGIDLEEYGLQEQLILQKQLKGALDADAIESSRPKVRSRMAFAAKDAKTVSRLDLHQACWTESHWVPVRFIDLDTGPSISDWKILWAPEFEVMACQFWNMIEKEVVVMPGAWVED